MPVSKQKPIHEWESILLDTGIILALFKKHAGSDDEGINFVNKLIKFLSETQTGKQTKRIFYISTVTLGEILTNEQDNDKIRRILRVLNGSDVEFLSYDIQPALAMNGKLKKYITREHLHQKAQELGFKTNDFGMGRQWIYADYMIAITAEVMNLDVILTLDKKTFYPICRDDLNINCILVYSEFFEHSESSFLNYKYEKVDSQ